MSPSFLSKPTLPAELVASITQCLEGSDLVSMSSACRSFAAEAEPLLYRSVVFEANELRTFTLYSSAVCSNLRKASFTKQMRLASILFDDGTDTHHRGRLEISDGACPLKTCAKALVNLTVLVVREPKEHLPRVPIRSSVHVTLTAFLGCAFRLQTLEIPRTTAEHAEVAFLTEQSTVQAFTADLYGRSPLALDLQNSHNLLPELHTAFLGSKHWFGHLDGRKIRRLSVSFPMSYDFKELRRMPLEHVATPAYITDTHLAMLERWLKQTWTAQLRSYTFHLAVTRPDAPGDALAIVAGLPKLTEVVINIRVDGRAILKSDFVPDAMALHPSLQRVTTRVYQLSPGNGKSWRPGQLGARALKPGRPSRTPWVTWCRTPEGEIIREGINIVNDESWRTLP